MQWFLSDSIEDVFFLANQVQFHLTCHCLPVRSFGCQPVNITPFQVCSRNAKPRSMRIRDCVEFPNQRSNYIWPIRASTKSGTAERISKWGGGAENERRRREFVGGLGASPPKKF